MINLRFSNRIWTSLVAVLLWSVVCMTAVGFAPSASALMYDKEILIGADFAGKDLTDSSFDHANLRQSNFSNSNLTGVRFFSSNLDSVDFSGADLRYADLESSRLTKANFTNAVLEGAFLTNSLLDGANIDGADFTDVLLRNDVQAKLCKIAKGTNPTTGRNTRDTLYCP